MSRSARVTFDWGDGTYTFRLGLSQLEELDEKCHVGPGFALGVLGGGLSGNWKAAWVYEVIRLGLIGGGLSPAPALNLARRYVMADDRPLEENIPAAMAILAAAVAGVEDDKPGERAGEGRTNPLSPTDASASPASTAPAPLRASRRAKSANAPSGRSKPTSPAGAAPKAQRSTTH